MTTTTNLMLSILSLVKHINFLESELRNSKMTIEELYTLNNIIKYAPDMIYWKDTHSTHLGCNDQFAMAAGFKNREEVIGKSDRDFPWHDQAEKYKADDQEVIATGESRLNIEDIMPFKNGKNAVVITNKVPLRNREGTIIGVLGIATDITNQKKIEHDLKIAKEAAESGERAKTEFIANMSHDIRTPLSGVVGLGGIVEQEIDNPSVRAKVHDMVKSAEELLNMLNEILDVVSLAKITLDEIHEEPFDLPYLVQTIIDLEQSSVDFKNIEIIQCIDENVPTVLTGDHKKIHHILLNLVGNAIKFTNKGHVSIHVKCLEKSNTSVQLRFEVSDTGMGIPAESIDKVFELFYKITPSYKGLDKGHGVGLHIVKTYTELLGGIITVESKLHEGSKFSFAITLKIPDQNTRPQNFNPKTFNKHPSPPLFLTQPSAVINAEPFLPKLPNAPEILIIEDNRVALTIAQTLVSQAKCNPTPAADGESALKLAKTKHFDLILSDVGLPGISGIEFTQQLRNHEKEQNKKPVPIVAITGHAEGKIHAECLAAGMNDVIIKPIRPEILTELFYVFSLFDTNKNHSESLDGSNIDKLASTKNMPKQKLVGMDLPDTEAQLFQLDKLSLLDAQHAIKELGNNKALLVDILKSFVESFSKDKQDLKTAYASGDWGQIAKLAHKIKGGTVYLKLNKLSTACQYLERYHKAGHVKLLAELYQQMMKIMDETLPVIAQWLKNQ